jgi:SWIM zinc finger
MVILLGFLSDIQRSMIIKMTLVVVENQKDRRYGKGIVIALSRKIIKLNKFVYRVESETTDNKFYSVVFVDGGPTSCNCPDYEHHKDSNLNHMCKHKYAVMAAIESNTIIDETQKKEELTVKPWREAEYEY